MPAEKYFLPERKEIIRRGDVFWKEGTCSLEPAVPLLLKKEIIRQGDVF
jgi:hypothetical protein